jgi:hypothetical protein
MTAARLDTDTLHKAKHRNIPDFSLSSTQVEERAGERRLLL